MDDLVERVADEFRRHHWGSCWPQCTDNEATLAARAIIPMVLEHAAKVAEFHRERWAAANGFEGQAAGARVIAAAIRAEVQHDAG